MNSNSNSTISVLIATDVTLHSDGVAAVLADVKGVSVVAKGNSRSEALDLARQNHPDVAVLDLDLEWPDLCQLVRDLHAGGTAPLLMSDTIDGPRVLELLQCGASGIISKDTNADLFRRCVHAVGSGEIWVRRQAINYLVHQMRNSAPEMVKVSANVNGSVPASKSISAESNGGSSRRPFDLTTREQEIVRAIGEAMTNRDIATQFGITECTVKHHLTKIFDKVGVDSRLELAVFASHHGLIERNNHVSN
ncbi:MAG TPA: response regulator transcription factor [Terriglobia bacterium]|nr:response regulator transcription factor [Terriglobia bacterium]